MSRICSGFPKMRGTFKGNIGFVEGFYRGFYRGYMRAIWGFGISYDVETS